MATAQQPAMSGAIMDYPEGNDNRGRFDINNIPNRFPDLGNFANDSDDGYDYDDDDDDDDDDFQDAWEDISNSAAAHQTAEALRQSKTIYNPVHPATATGEDNDVDEAEADGIALGVIPDHEARRWRHRRMRLARYIQFVDGPAIDDNDVPAPLARWLDLDVDVGLGLARDDGAPQPVTAPVVKGGQGRGGMGSFLAARSAPGAGDLRKRREWVDIGADADAGAGAGAGSAPPVPAAPAQPVPTPSRRTAPQPPQQQQQQQQQQPLSEKARGKLPAVAGRGHQAAEDPFVIPRRSTRAGGHRRRDQTSTLDFAPRRSPRRPAAFRGFEAGGSSAALAARLDRVRKLGPEDLPGSRRTR